MTTERSRVEIRIGAELEASVRRAFNRAVDEVGKLDDEVMEADRRVRQLDQRFERIGGTLRGLGGALAGFGAAVTGAIGLSVNNTLENIRELREEATRQSVSLRDAAVSQQIALNLGLEGDAGRAVEIFGELERRIENIDEADLFESLGLDQDRLRVLEDFERLDVVVRRILEAPASLRGGLVDRLLGGEGGEAIAQLLTGVDTIEEWNDAVRRAENNPRVVNIDNLEEAQREMAQLRNEFTDLQTQVTLTFIPTLRSLADFIAPVLQGTRQWADENPQLANRLGVTAAAAGAVGGAMLGIGAALPALHRGYNALIAATRIGTAVQWAWNAALLANPLVLTAVAVGGLAVALGALYLATRDNTREVDRLIGQWDEAARAAAGYSASVTTADGQLTVSDNEYTETVLANAQARIDARSREEQILATAQREGLTIEAAQDVIEARRQAIAESQAFRSLAPEQRRVAEIEAQYLGGTPRDLRPAREQLQIVQRITGSQDTSGTSGFLGIDNILRALRNPFASGEELRAIAAGEAREARLERLDIQPVIQSATVDRLDVNVDIQQDAEGNITGVSARSGGEVADARLR